jgi:hypothetical protein
MWASGIFIKANALFVQGVLAFEGRPPGISLNPPYFPDRKIEHILDCDQKFRESRTSHIFPNRYVEAERRSWGFEDVSWLNLPNCL